MIRLGFLVTKWSTTGGVRLRHQSDREKSIKLTSVLLTNGGSAAKSLILNGGGIGPLLDYAFVDELKSGRLVKVLPDWDFEKKQPIYLVFPDRIRIPAKTRILIDFIKSNTKHHLPGE